MFILNLALSRSHSLNEHELLQPTYSQIEVKMGMFKNRFSEDRNHCFLKEDVFVLLKMKDSRNLWWNCSCMLQQKRNFLKLDHIPISVCLNISLRHKLFLMRAWTFAKRKKMREIWGNWKRQNSWLNINF